MTLLWYVHHHGTGHWRRALAVASRLEEPVTFLSSRPSPWPLPAGCTLIDLPPDTPGESRGADAGGRLHWAPLGQSGLLARHRIILDAAAGASRAVVDVSVEIAVLLRVSGIAVTLVELPGDRSDRPHELARDLAHRVISPVPADWELTGAGVTAVGLVSKLPAAVAAPAQAGPVVVVVVAGAGGGGVPAASLAALRASHQVVLADGSADIGPLLQAASVVVGGAGLGTVADVAAIARPFVMLPADRPFGEQAATAAACARHENVITPSAPPSSALEWRDVIGKAIAAGPFCADANGAERFAALLRAT